VDISVRDLIAEMAKPERVCLTFDPSHIRHVFGIHEELREDHILYDVDLDLTAQHLREKYVDSLDGSDSDPDDPPDNAESSAPRCHAFRVKDGVVTTDPCKVTGAGNLAVGQNGLLYCETPSHIKQGDVITDPRENLRFQLTQPRVDVPLVPGKSRRRVANVVPDGRGGGDYPSVIPGDKDVHVGPQMLGDENLHMPHVSADKGKELDELLRQLPDFDPALDEDRVSKVRNLLILGRLDIDTFTFRDSAPVVSRAPRIKRGGGRRPASTQAPSGGSNRSTSNHTKMRGSAAVDESQLEECIRALLKFVDEAPAAEFNMTPDPDVFADMCVATFEATGIDTDTIRELALAAQS
jgi:hypothetical protein